MADVIPFPRFRPIQPVTPVLVDIRDHLIATMRDDLCPACKGRGIFAHKGKLGAVVFASCPCGGDDENRIVSEDPEFDGVA